MGRCSCAASSQMGTPPTGGSVLYTCPVCVGKALTMLKRLTSQLEFAILDTPISVSAPTETEDTHGQTRN